MAEASLPIRAEVRLPVPAELAGGRARCEVEAAEAAAHIFVGGQQGVGAFAWFICMGYCHLLPVSTISYCNVDRATGIQCVVVHSI